MSLEEFRKDYGFSSKGDRGIFREVHRPHDARPKVWKTCCPALFWLLKIDGLDEHWEVGVHSELGEHYDADVIRRIPEAIRR